MPSTNVNTTAAAPIGRGRENNLFDPLFHPALQELTPSMVSNSSPPPPPSVAERQNSNLKNSYGFPSVHSDFRSETTSVMSSMMVDDDASALESESEDTFEPPTWRTLENGNRISGFWRGVGAGKSGLCYHLHNQQHMFLGDSSSRATTPHDDDGDGNDGGQSDFDEEDALLDRAVRTRLPTGSLSPEKERSPEPEITRQASLNAQMSKIKEEDEESGDEKVEDTVEDLHFSDLKDLSATETKEVADNYIRFAVRAEVQQRTEPIEAVVSIMRSAFGTWKSMIASILVATLSFAAMRSLSRPASMRPVPDLVKVAGLARSFEPLIYYSENGVREVSNLQATGVAVWDLSESVRSSNMSSAPMIVKELDDLSESLKTLAIELTKFFANVDGDIDSILIVMDWARRELTHLQTAPTAPFASAFDNVHNALSGAGLLEDSSGEPTSFGSLVTTLFGQSTPQRHQQTLKRTFNEFLAVLEEAISNELQHSLNIFAIFEAIDQQFLNLARTVIRESSVQEELHADALSSLWTRILGANAKDVRKYEQNRELLQHVRKKTVLNKGMLVDHNNRLLTLKAQLESLRRKLVSPLVRSENGSRLTLGDQVRGLEGVGEYLEDIRRRQKGKFMELLYGERKGEKAERGLIGEGI